MLSVLRSVGARGVSREELFDAGIANPGYLAERLREQGHSIIEAGARRGYWHTTTFMLVVDADPQEPLFEGEGGELLVLST